MDLYEDKVRTGQIELLMIMNDLFIFIFIYPIIIIDIYDDQTRTGQKLWLNLFD